MQKIFILGLVSVFSIALSFGAKEKFLGNGEIINLDPPVLEGGMPVYQAMNERKSQRGFKHGDELTMAQLSQLLWAGYGPNRPNMYKTSASNKAKFGLDLYVFKEDGTYKYLPDTAQMERVNDRDYRGITGNDPWVPDAAVNVCFIGVLERESYIPDIKIQQLICRNDSGHVAMNMLLYCASEGLQCVPRANIVQEGILEILGILDLEKYYVPLCFSAGP